MFLREKKSLRVTLKAARESLALRHCGMLLLVLGGLK